jgi:tRNA-specific 2-thiouridylase
MVSQKNKLRAFVGLSGGVDSAVSAALLKKDGYDVTGVFIKAWTPEGYPCTWKEDRRSAMKVAAVLDIPFITLDLEKEYKMEVADYMIAEYKIGRTPNPDVMCNKEIKFGHFLKFALKNGADFVATGHYCQTSPPAPLLNKERGEEKINLIEGKDKNKDQSYFLWTLNQKQLKHILFPVGHLNKNEVRELAERFGLPQATKKDSQGLCFLGQVDMKEFLGRYIPKKRGNVLLAPRNFSEVGNKDGKIIGYHNGALFFTIGERHGFTITEKTDKDVPLYVAAKNVNKNTITVAPKIAPQFFSGDNSVIIQNVNWVGTKMPDLSKKYSARIRYRQEKVECRIKKEGKKIKVIFEKPQMGVSAGQSLVLYGGEICLGGGIIDSTSSL